MKNEIKEIIVVEGKTDTNKLKSIFNVDTIETNGSEISNSTLELIKRVNKIRGVILFLDPDGPGEKIRKKIIEYVKDDIKNCFISKNDIKSTKKIGIAEADKNAIIKALDNVITFSYYSNSINLEQWNKLNINSNNIRKFICDFLKISYCNNKQLFKRVNMLGLTYDNLKDIIQNYENISK